MEFNNEYELLQEIYRGARMGEEGTPEELAESLVFLALDHGGRDNVTVVLVRVKEEKRTWLKKLFAGE